MDETVTYTNGANKIDRTGVTDIEKSLTITQQQLYPLLPAPTTISINQPVPNGFHYQQQSQKFHETNKTDIRRWNAFPQVTN